MNHNVGVILNHMRGTPDTWAKLGPLQDVMGTVARELGASVHRARLAGVDAARIVVDPGLGFGKRKEQNSEILARLGQLASLELPIMVGASRKSFLAQASEMGTKFATAAAVTASILGGAHMVRVHDVAEMRPVIQVADEILKGASIPE
jgi:dihydropteroate synthase